MNVTHHKKHGFTLAVLVGLYGAGAGPADGYTWIPGNGSFQTPTKWSPNGIPGPADIAEFNFAASPTVTFAAAANTSRLFVSDFSNVTFNLTGFNYTLSAPVGYQMMIGTPGVAGGVPQLVLTNGTLTANLADLGGYNGGLGGSLQVSSGATLNVSDVLMVGEFETSYLNVVNGGDVVIPPSGHLVVAFEDNLASTVTVQGAGSTLNAGEHLHLGWFGDGQINVSSGGAFSAGTAYLGQEASSTGTASVQSGGTWTTSGEMQVGDMGTGTLTVSNAGTTLSNGLTSIGFAAGSTGNATIETGATASLGFTTVGNSGSGSLTIRSGAIVTSGPEATIAAFPGSTGSVTLTDAGSSWSIAGNLGVGGAALGGPAGGTGTLTINTGTTVSVAGLGFFGTTLWTGGTITLNGGTLTTPRFTDNGGTLAFNSGTLSLTNSDFIIGTNGLLGASRTIGPAMTLSVSGATSIESGAALSINGGTFSTGSLNNNGAFAFNSGTLAITGAGGLTIGSGGPLGGAFTLGAGHALNVTNTTTVNGGAVLVIESGGTLTSGTLANNGAVVLDGAAAVLGGTVVSNSGLIRGEGVVSANVTNAASGEIRAQTGKTLTLAGINGTNTGTINLQGGTAEFSQVLTNGAAGQILGRGTLSVGGAGLTNNGHVALSSGITDVFGDVSNVTGSATIGITISGNADVTFWDDVTNGVGSLFKVSSGSSVTVFGTYSGAGISGNANDIHLEADVSPGFSPAVVDFGGNVHFSSTTTLKIELGGTTAGSQYDQVHVSEQLTLDGTLHVALIDLGGGLFSPASGHSFDILDWGSRSGTFSAIELPALAGGLVWNTSQLYTTGVLSVGLPGDFNANGVVDAADYVVWRKDPNRTQAQYDVWRAHFGQPPGSGSGARANASVPEPTTLVLLLVGMIALFTCRCAAVS